MDKKKEQIGEIMKIYDFDDIQTIFLTQFFEFSLQNFSDNLQKVDIYPKLLNPTKE